MGSLHRPKPPLLPREAAAASLHALLLSKLPPGEERVPWEELPEFQRGETLVLVDRVLLTYRAAGGRLP